MKQFSREGSADFFDNYNYEDEFDMPVIFPTLGPKLCMSISTFSDDECHNTEQFAQSYFYENGPQLPSMLDCEDDSSVRMTHDQHPLPVELERETEVDIRCEEDLALGRKKVADTPKVNQAHR
jgi:hypothetical protein